MPLVITDSSILIGLEQIGHLPLLPGLFRLVTWLCRVTQKQTALPW